MLARNLTLTESCWAGLVSVSCLKDRRRIAVFATEAIKA